MLKPVTAERYILYKKAIWLYITLLIFEGALRKWFLPEFATPLLIVRDPIVIWLVLAGFRKGWLRNGYAIAMMVFSTISFVMTLLVGHHNLYTALFGWRIYVLYFPFIFVLGHILNKEDLLKIGKFMLYLSIPMTLLIILQFYSPQSAWVNQGIGQNTEGAGFGGVLGYFRPPGTFTFIAGFTDFQMLVGCYLFYFLLANKTLEPKFQIKSWLLWVILVCYLLTIPYSISRAHFFQTVVILIFVLLIGLFAKKRSLSVTKTLVWLFLGALIIFLFDMASEGINAFIARFAGANRVEGGLIEGVAGKRFFGSTVRSFNADLPFWGYGIGLGTSAGSELANTKTIYAYFNGEEEWSRVTGECGLFIGYIILGIRCLFSLSLFIKAFKMLKRGCSFLPWMLMAGVILMVPIFQWGQVTHIGFAALVAGLTLAAIKTGNTEQSNT